MRFQMRRRVRFAGVLAALALLFLVTAAPGGGGAGGGGGGFGGGGGGFGGGGRGRTGATERPPEWVAWVLVGLVPTALLAVHLLSRFRIVHIVVDLRHGERYVPALDQLLCKSDFSLPATRVQTLALLGKLLNPEDVVEGWVAVSETARSVQCLDEQAERLWKRQLRRAHITRKLPHVRAPSDLVAEDHCLLGIVATVGWLERFRPGDADSAREALRRLTAAVPGALYIYYAPDPGKRLRPEAARMLLEGLRAGG